jgi:hypothetical protein
LGLCRCAYVTGHVAAAKNLTGGESHSCLLYRNYPWAGIGQYLIRLDQLNISINPKTVELESSKKQKP